MEGTSAFSVVRAEPDSTRGWRSQYYGDKEPAISIMLEAHQPRAWFWTFFGSDEDVVESSGNDLKIKWSGGEISFNLSS